MLTPASTTMKTQRRTLRPWDSSAVYGNLADAMKDSIVLFPDTLIVQPAVMAPPLDNDDVEPSLYEV